MAKSITQVYDQSIMKTLNERLRKIEKVYKTDLGVSYSQAGKSAFWNTARDWAFNEPNGRGKFFKVETNEQGIITKVRFKSKTELRAMEEAGMLTPDDVKKFRQIIKGATEAPTSTKTGILASEQKAYTTFRQNNPEQFERKKKKRADMSEEEKEKIDKENEDIEARNRAKAQELKQAIGRFMATNKDHFAYARGKSGYENQEDYENDKRIWSLISANYDLEKLLVSNADQGGSDAAYREFMDYVWDYAASERWEEIPDKYRL